MSRKHLFFLPLLLFFISGCHLYNRQIEIAVHRGANRQAPENTMSSALKAIETGSHYLEVDVRRSKDGVYFNFHDRTLNRTTNGTGNFGDFTSDELKKLDAGSWFRHSFRGEKIPTIEEQVLSFKESINFYFDFKSGDINEFIELVKRWGVADNCFFNVRNYSDLENMESADTETWSPIMLWGDYLIEDLQALTNSGIAFKLNVSSINEFNEMWEKWKPPIIEVRVSDLSRELVKTAHDKGVKVMAYIPGDQFEQYLHCLRYEIDMVNIDNPDVFRYILENNELPPPLWIAHRGTVVNDNFVEYQPEGIEEAFNRSYAGVEIDIWITLDDHLVVHHDRDLEKFFGADVLIDELTLEEAKSYTSLHGNFGIMTLDEYLDLIPEDAILMLDLKCRTRSETYYSKIRESITRRHSFDQTIIIDRDAREHFWGEVRFSVRVAEMPEIFAKWRNGEDVACHYFLFDHGNVLSAQWVKLAQSMSMEVIPSVNKFHYRNENFLFGGVRDIHYLRKLGVMLYQIDAVFEENLDIMSDR